MTIWIFTGDKPSNGAKALCQAPGFKRLRTGKFFKKGDVIVNWGTSKQAPVMGPVLNDPQAVLKAANKFFTFSALAGENVACVQWTANKAVAKEWLDSGCIVVVRKTLTGHSGAGIIIVEKGQELEEAPLYTKYLFKVREFRVHATPTAVIDTQMKVRDPAVVPKSWKVRSHDNGFIFQRKNITPSEKRDALAIQAVKVLGLHFGAVDIVEDKKGNFYVLEINTAPGLEGQTVAAYNNALTELANDVAKDN
jgi:glutathione synthase/RimK-type ligase-like ATP-grasp enzyme